MKHPESKLQQSCIKWFDYQYPQYKLNLFAIQNGGARNKIEAGIMKGEGVRSGVSDLFLAIPKQGLKNNYPGLFIEMKTQTGRQTDTQKEFEKAVNSQGYFYFLCRSFDEFKAMVEFWISESD